MAGCVGGSKCSLQAMCRHMLAKGLSDFGHLCISVISQQVIRACQFAVHIENNGCLMVVA